MCAASSPLFPDADSSEKRFDTLAEWLSWQEGLHYTAIDLGLARCCQVAERMGLLKPDFKIISIAGTNGKGSSAAMLDMLFRGAGYRVACYTSPHLVHYNERICINGLAVSDAALCESFSRIDTARGDISLTYFEFGTLAALDVFHRSGVELAIMEVGLGGRLDAVNIVDADVSLVTAIDLDHEQWLGHDRESIGREKAGIFRPMRPAICSDAAPPASISDSAEIAGAQLYLSGRDFSYEFDDQSWSWFSDGVRLSGLPRPGMNDDNQVRNAAGVLKVLQLFAGQFPVEQTVIRACMRDFHLPGRFQLFPGEITYILDVAHNRQAATALAENLRKLRLTGKTHLVIGMLKDKNYDAVLTELCAIADYWYLAGLENARGTSADELTEVLVSRPDGKNYDLGRYNNVAAALEAARTAARTGDRIVVTGSFITVGDAIAQLQFYK